MYTVNCMLYMVKTDTFCYCILYTIKADAYLIMKVTKMQLYRLIYYC